MYYIFSFRLRSQSIAFYEAVTGAGIGAKIISTPRSVSIGCGLSVKICAGDIDACERILDAASHDTFLGLFYHNGSELTRVRG